MCANDFQVESRTRYMSVSCRKVNDEDDQDQTEIRKQSTAELPQDRVAYYKLLQGQVKIGSQDLTFNHRQVWVTTAFIVLYNYQDLWYSFIWVCRMVESLTHIKNILGPYFLKLLIRILSDVCQPTCKTQSFLILIYNPQVNGIIYLCTSSAEWGGGTVPAGALWDAVAGAAGMAGWPWLQHIWLPPGFTEDGGKWWESFLESSPTGSTTACKNSYTQLA